MNRGVEGFADAGRQGLGAGMHRGRLTVPRVSATRREIQVSGRFKSGNVHHFNARTPTHEPRPTANLATRCGHLFNAVSNAERPSHGCPVGYRGNTGCCASVRYTVFSTPFARALLTKAFAGTRWSAMTAPFAVAHHSRAGLFARTCGRLSSSLVHRSLFQ